MHYVLTQHQPIHDNAALPPAGPGLATGSLVRSTISQLTGVVVDMQDDIVAVLFGDSLRWFKWNSKDPKWVSAETLLAIDE